MRLIDKDELLDFFTNNFDVMDKVDNREIHEIIEFSKDIKPLEDLKLIYQMVWDCDIPSPTIQEYIEHHEACVEIMNKIKEVMKKYD